MTKFKKRKSGRFRAFARKAVRRSGVGNSGSLFQLDAMAYGAVRAPISNKVKELVPVQFLGDLGDEVAMGLICYLVQKNTSGMISNVAKKGLVIENARVGETLIGMTGFGQSVQSGNNALGI